MKRENRAICAFAVVKCRKSQKSYLPFVKWKASATDWQIDCGIAAVVCLVLGILRSTFELLPQHRMHWSWFGNI